jgi:hypothetical protein
MDERRCPAGHRLPGCLVCGVDDESECNGGQYVSDYIKRAARKAKGKADETDGDSHGQSLDQRNVPAGGVRD